MQWGGTDLTPKEKGVVLRNADITRIPEITQLNITRDTVHASLGRPP